MAVLLHFTYGAGQQRSPRFLSQLRTSFHEIGQEILSTNVFKLKTVTQIKPKLLWLHLVTILSLITFLDQIFRAIWRKLVLCWSENNLHLRQVPPAYVFPPGIESVRQRVHISRR